MSHNIIFWAVTLKNDVPSLPALTKSLCLPDFLSEYNDVAAEMPIENQLSLLLRLNGQVLIFLL